MIRLYRHKTNGTYLLIENREGKQFEYTFTNEAEAKRAMARLKRNAFKRGQNQCLRDITGTSASAARLDMGLSKV